jgi:hypothetical protein
MEYRDHPLLEGFQDKPDADLLDVAIAQIEYAAWVSKGAKFGEDGIPDEVKRAIRDGFKDAPRAGLEKFLYHAIVQAVKSDRQARAKDKK